MDFEKANPSDAHYMAATGQAIAPEFWEYWSSHGLDFGDEGVSFRESLALFGYPVSPAAMDTNADGDTVLTQWFERARFELHGDTVLLGRLGAEMLDDSDGFSIRFRNELEAAFQMTFDRFSSPGMLAGVWLDGVGSWESVIGAADWDSGAEYTPDMHQRIGSITKTFTGVLILQLVDEGLISLDDTVDEWFDGVTYGDQITLRQMLSMTSGIASYTLSTQWQSEYFAEPERVWTPQELVDFSLSLPPSFMPGEFFEYSNTNFLMLGMIVEYVTGQTYADVIQERIFDPLGMTNSSSPLLEDVMPEPYARGITEQGQPEGETAETTFWNPAWGFGTGNLVSTFNNLYAWGQALGTGALLSEELFAEQLTWDTQPPTTPDMSYGLGIGYYGNNWIGHAGSLPGYNTDLLYNTELDATIIVLTNSDITIPNPDNPNGTLSPAPTTGQALRAVLEREVELQGD
jgi:D-alanyl-D-alanine carboxypeptidase